LVQLSHHDFVQYRLPGTGELMPLLRQSLRGSCPAP
jgi:hypothetical protein